MTSDQVILMSLESQSHIS